MCSMAGAAAFRNQQSAAGEASIEIWNCSCVCPGAGALQRAAAGSGVVSVA